MDYIKELRKEVGNRPLILTGSVVTVINDKDEVLLQQKPCGQWAIPGGLMELGESAEDAGRREVLEETGIEVGKLKLLSVFSGPQYFVTLDNGDQFYPVTIAYVTRDIIGGTLSADGEETIEARYFPIENLPEKTSPLLKSMLKQFPYRESGSVWS